MPNKKDDSEPCVKCGGDRVRAPAGSVYCPTCVKRYREENRERILRRDREYYSNNKEKCLATMGANRQGIQVPRKPGLGPNQISYLWRRRGNEGSRHPEYAIWSKMKGRCLNTNSPDYSRYGERGITVCDRWKDSFDNFLEDMGPRPEPRNLYSIERVNNNGNYEPGNCKWATRTEQNNNTRRNTSYRISIPDDTLVPYEGRGVTLKELSEITGIHLVALKYRWTKHPDCTDWILHSEFDNRHFEYKGHKYNLVELSHISGIPYPNIRARLFISGWSVEKTMETELERRT